MNACPLCVPSSNDILWRGAHCYVIDVGDPDYAGYCRVIWNAHVREMTELAPSDRDHFMRIVYTVEAALRALLQPTKINLASLGNQVPHLHWHVIARFSDDPHFPDPIWAVRRRDSVRRALDRDALRLELRRHLGTPA